MHDPMTNVSRVWVIGSQPNMLTSFHFPLLSSTTMALLLTIAIQLMFMVCVFLFLKDLLACN